jgi:uncharacterized protein YndB with AHSA1/START domain
MSEPTVIFDTIRAERHFPYARHRLFRAWSDPLARQRMEPTPHGMQMVYDRTDFRVGGYEQSRLLQNAKEVARFHQHFVQIIEDALIVFSVTVFVENQAVTCSQTAIEFFPQGIGTTLNCTEQVAWLHGQNMRSGHEDGWNTLFDRLNVVLGNFG